MTKDPKIPFERETSMKDKRGILLGSPTDQSQGMQSPQRDIRQGSGRGLNK